MLFCNDSKRPGGFFPNSLVAKKEIIRKNMFIFSVSFSNTLRFFSKMVVYVQCATHVLKHNCGLSKLLVQ